MKKYCNKHYSFYETLQGCKDCGFEELPSLEPKSFSFDTRRIAATITMISKKAHLKMNISGKVTRPRFQEIILDLISMDAFLDKTEAEELYKECVAWENG